MDKNTMIIITGPSGVGKTVLCDRIKNKLNITCVERDSIKEILFDVLGYSDREWSMKLGQATYEILFSLVERLLQGNNTFVIESNFNPKSLSNFIAKLREKYQFKVYIINCIAEERILFERYKKRIETGERHPGHGGENVSFEEYRKFIVNGDIEGLLPEDIEIKLDMTEFSNINYDSTIEDIKKYV